MPLIFKRTSTTAWWLSLSLLACSGAEPATAGPSAGGETASGGTAPTGSVGGTYAEAGGAAGNTASQAGSSGTAGVLGAASGHGGSGAGGMSTHAGAGSGGTTSTTGGGGAANGGGGVATMGGGAGGALRACTGSEPVVTVYTIGDSTMSVYDAKAYPRMGWGQPLGDLFLPSCARVVDKALSGRSSKSFLDEGAWKPVMDGLKSGDYVLIQFGHNDEKSDDATRYTEPQTTYKQFLTTYVNDTRAKEARPILLTSINRNSWSGTMLGDTHKGYPPAVRELAKTLDVPLIDLEALTRNYFQRIGPSETAKLFMILAPGQSPNYPEGETDNTHLQEKGARAIGQLAMADAYARQLPLAALLKGMPTPP